MAKILLFENDAKQKILAGVEKLEKAVSVTLGPAGKNVIIDEYGSIHSTRDGVTVAKSISLKDPFENIGANAIKEVAEKSNARAGDGTTTSTVLCASIFKNGLKYVSLGSNATQIKNGIAKAAREVVSNVRKMSTPISTKDDIKQVATVSANGDKSIGEIIANVMDKIGKDGTIKVENGNSMEMTSKIVEGMVIDQSYASPYMVTNPETGDAELENPFVLIANKKIANIQEMLPCLQGVNQTGASLLIIADDYQEDILATLVMNKLRGFNCVAIKSPSFGSQRKLVLDDIATLCGGRVVSDETGTKLENATPGANILGRAARVVVSKDNTVIIGGVGDAGAIEQRAEALRKQIESAEDQYDKEKLQERLAKLTSGIGIISVGATTDAERKELRDRVDDAFYAAKAAVKGGIVPGGGVALLKTMHAIENANSNEYSGDEVIGRKILLDSLESPVRKILDNAGVDSSVVISKLLVAENGVHSNGYNVLTKQYVDMVEDGIIDPTEVVVNEVMNAASVAGLLLTTEALVVEEPKKETCNPGGCAGQGMMPGMM